jgi:hypothetical protein
VPFLLFDKPTIPQVAPMAWLYSLGVIIKKEKKPRNYINMRLITWNCQGAFRKKAEAILTQKPDILIVQECEHPDKLLFDLTTQLPTDFLWFGDHKHNGLGIFSYSEYRFQLHDKYN